MSPPCQIRLVTLREAFRLLENRIQQFFGPPIQSLETLDLQCETDSIGKGDYDHFFNQSVCT